MLADIEISYIPEPRHGQVIQSVNGQVHRPIRGMVEFAEILNTQQAVLQELRGLLSRWKEQADAGHLDGVDCGLLSETDTALGLLDRPDENEA